MPAISSYNYTGPLAYSDRLIGVFSGATNGVSLQQFRDFFGVGTNIISVPTYPVDPTAAELGKNGDILLVDGTGKLYRRANGTYPPESQSFMSMQGTRVNDTAVSAETSWSSAKIQRMLASTRNAHLTFVAGALTKVLSWRSRFAVETLTVNRGTNEFSFKIIKSNGTQVGTYATAADVNLAVAALSDADVQAGFDLEISYTGTAPTCTAIFQAIVL
jgi:hypothetical protein